MSSTTSPDRSLFIKERHIKYWLRCLKTYLPNAYTSNDSNRMTLAFFTLSALDLLGALHETTTPSERRDYIDWIYLCQHPSGGFRGFTGTNFGYEARSDGNACWDPANLAGTFFALVALAVLGDDLARVQRRECLAWLTKLQCDDGSFGETLGRGHSIEGGRDVRFCYLAAVARWVLRGPGKGIEDVGDVNVDRLAAFVIASKACKAPFQEAHAGLTYCGVCTLSLLGRLPSTSERKALPGDTATLDGGFVQDVLHWLVHRQSTILFEEAQLLEIPVHSVSRQDEGPGGRHDAQGNQHYPDRLSPPTHDGGPPQVSLGASVVQGASLDVDPIQDLPARSRYETIDLNWIGFNGRTNKVADTCYSFWVGGTLGIFKKVHLVSFNAIRRYLLEKTQHVIGGFGKFPGDPPDILHSYLGLAGLATMKEPGLKSLDPTLCISVSAREHLESLPWRIDDAFSHAEGKSQKTTSH